MVKYTKRVSLGYKKDVLTGKMVQVRTSVTVWAENDDEAVVLIENERERLRKLLLPVDNVTVETMDDLVEYYYKIKDWLKPTTVSNDFNIWESLRHYFGSMKITEINHIKLLNFLEAKENESWGKSSIHNAYKTLNKYMNFAVAQEFIDKNPLGRLKFNSCSKQPKPKKLDGMESVIENFYRNVFRLKNTPTAVKFKVMLLLSADGCLRKTELMGLTTDKINLTDGYIEVDKNLYQLTRKEAIKVNVDRKGYTTTKTEGSTRKLPLSGITIKYLELYLSNCEAYLEKNRLTNNNKYLFYSTRNIPYRKSNGKRYNDAPFFDVKASDMSMFNLSLRRYCIVFGYKPFTSHKIRKWSYTERLNLDIQIEYANYVLGHSMGKSDSVYVLSNLYRGAKKQHFKWEKYLNNVLSGGL